MDCCQTIIFSNKAYNAIIDETFKKEPIETGGILLGHILDNGIWIVMEVLPPGINSIHQYAYFEYDEVFANYLAQSIASKYETELNLLGLWHRHPGSMDYFSGTDDGTNLTFARLNSRGAISGLVNVDPKFRLTMRHVSSPLHYEIVDFEVGDDLIPEEYFRLKHFPDKGLHPQPSELKKVTETVIENGLGIKSLPKITETNKEQASFSKWFKARIVYPLCVIFALFSVLWGISYVPKNDNNRLVSLYKIVNNGNIPEVKAYKAYWLYQHSMSPEMDSRDSVRILSSNFDKIKGTTRARVQCTQGEKYYAHSWYLSTLYKIIAAFIISLIILLVPAPSYRKEWLICSCILLFSIFASILLSGKSLLLIALNAILIFLSCYLVSLIAIKVHRDVLKNKYKPWFLRHSELFISEDSDIQKMSRDVGKDSQNGILSYTIVTEKKVRQHNSPLAFQLIYHRNFAEQKKINLFFITPSLNALVADFPDANMALIKKDSEGEMYFEIPFSDKHGHYAKRAVEQIYNWLNIYNESVKS